MTQSTPTRHPATQRRLDDLVVLLDSIQEYADRQGLLFDDENRDTIDAVVRRLAVALDGWGDLAPYIPPRCLDWQVRDEGGA